MVLRRGRDSFWILRRGHGFEEALRTVCQFAMMNFRAVRVVAFLQRRVSLEAEVHLQLYNAPAHQMMVGRYSFKRKTAVRVIGGFVSES